MNEENYALKRLKHAFNEKDIELGKLKKRREEFKEFIEENREDIAEVIEQLKDIAEGIARLGTEPPASQHWEKMALAFDKTVKDEEAKK